MVDCYKQKRMSIIEISDDPSLDIGNPGCFDDNGVILGDIFLLEKSYIFIMSDFSMLKR